MIRKWKAFTTDLIYSSDGKLLASSGDGVKIWDAATGRLLRTLVPVGKHRPNFVFASDCNIAFSPDGKLLVYASDIHMASSTDWHHSGEYPQVWDVQTGKLLCTLPGQFTENVAFSGDGQSVFCVQRDNPSMGNPLTLCRINVQTGLVEWSDRRIEDDWAICALAASSHSSTLACQTCDHQVLLIDANTGRLRRRGQALVSHSLGPSNPAGMGISDDGKTLINREVDGVSVWDTSALR